MLNLKNTLDGYLKNVEVIGNTIQDTNNLANIRSVGDKVEGQELYNISIQVDNGNGVSEIVEILSPVQLEKVGDVADKILCKDGVWGVEKNIKTVVLNGSENWSINGASASSMRFSIVRDKSVDYDLVPSVDVILSDMYVKRNIDWNSDIEGIENGANDLSIRVSRTRLSTHDVAGFKKWLESNNTLVKYQTQTSQFIPLPQDQQVKLRTFVGQTNISFLTEIPGQIKAQVPKSLGATVNTHTEQIADLHNSLDRVKKLEETTVSTVETESSFTAVDATSNGYFEDVKLEGKTLVNVLRLGGGWFEQETTLQTDSTDAIGLSNYPKSVDLSLLKSNTVYTVVPFVDYNVVKKGMLYLQLNTEINGIPNAVFRIDEAMFNKPTLITTKELTNKNSRSLFLGGANCEYKVKNVKILMLEGDHTNNPPEFFEGLMSVGQDVEEVSVGSMSYNLFNPNESEFSTLYISGSSNGTITSSSGLRSLDFKCKPNTTYTISTKLYGNAFRVFASKQKPAHGVIGEVLYNKNSTTNITINSGNNEYLLITYYSYNETPDVTEQDVLDGFQIKLGELKPYIPRQSNIKPLLYFNPTTETWEKLVLRKWDTIEKHSDGKYYYHKRSREVILNGDVAWRKSSHIFGNKHRYIYDTKGVLGADLTELPLCDKYNIGIINSVSLESNSTLSYNHLGEQFYLDVEVSTVEEFNRNYIVNNPFVLVYKLKQEEVYECTSIDLLAYSGETNYIINSGAISPKSLLKVHNNISNVVKILQEKVSLLENTFIAGLKSVLSGDMYSLATILYPEDFEQNDNTEQDIMVIPE